MIVIRIIPQFEESFTEVFITGEHEESVANVLTSDYLSAEAEVFRMDEDGEWIAAEEIEHG